MSLTIPAARSAERCWGSLQAFRLIEPERVFVLHTPCFSAWIDVVVEPKLREGAAE